MHLLPATLYSTQQIELLEQQAAIQYGIPSFELMMRAGYEVFYLLRQLWRCSKSITLFCGVGNNAGDGYIVANMARAAGFRVTLYSIIEPNKLTGNALGAYHEYIANNGTVLLFDENIQIQSDVVIDALLGTGLNRPLSDTYLSAVQLINNTSIPVLAIDIPSGLHADTGRVMGDAVKANCTLSFVGLKYGLFTGQAAEYAGNIFYSSLSLPPPLFDTVQSHVYRVQQRSFPARPRCAHKGHNGHVLIVGGEHGYMGAALLAGEAALRVGSGLVSIATRPEHAMMMSLHKPELMCHGIENAEQLKPLLEKASVIVVGPGLGQTEWARDLLLAVIDTRKFMIIDADALNILSKIPSAYNNLVLSPYNRAVLTPHVGEAARLLSLSTLKIQQDRFAAVQALQKKYGGIAILKGAGTLIASHDDIAISDTGNPGMASGGMGDALAGIIAGLLAQGFTLKDAAQQGVYIHGLAADQAAEADGERGLVATDLMPYLRRLVNSPSPTTVITA
jgi:NAD(P)H-hydrate epimerase